MNSSPEAGLIIQEATAAQLRAADPSASVLVNASAGTGKTKVLTDRILSLLLQGSTPDKILALTFTKAAAGEMLNRLLGRLSKWATCEQADLHKEIYALIQRDPDQDQMDRAQSLFARVLDTPGGLKIQTIHAFCQSLLARFPLEANLPPNFQLIEDRTVEELLREARERTLFRAKSNPGSALTLALLKLSAQMQDQKFSDIMSKVASSRHRIEGFLTSYGGLTGAAAALRSSLGVANLVSSQSVANELLNAEFLTKLQSFADLLATSKTAMSSNLANDINKSLKSANASSLEKSQYLIKSFLVTGKDGENPVSVRTRLPSADVKKAYPHSVELFEEIATTLAVAHNQLSNLALLELNEALLTVADAILTDYRATKQSRVALDFEDLIARTRDLLSQQNGAAWVMYKLDGGIDHALIDEAQDTSPSQWQIIQAISGDFFSGEQERGTRTVFAVGDYKQSIFSFQGANPEELDRMNHYFADRVTAAKQKWVPVNLNVSFRTAPGILSLVDKIFSESPAGRGLMLPGKTAEDWPQHLASRQGQETQIELWPLIAHESDPGDDGVAITGASSLSETLLARKIAERIHYLCQSLEGLNDPATFLPSQDRRLQAGDFMILLQQRGQFAAQLNRSLQRLDIPVAGLDRLALEKHIGVQDLVVLGKALLLPEDDLTLATALKGPFINLTEEELLELAVGRGNKSLWSALIDRQEQDSSFMEALGRLNALTPLAMSKAPYEFFCHLLYRFQGLSKLINRLGNEVIDPVQEFLSIALSFEKEHPPSLEGFLHWFSKGSEEVKRDMDQTRNEVRIMTVHGSKGLQAPVVILADCHRSPSSKDAFFWIGDKDTKTDDHVFLWAPGKKSDSRETRGVRERAKSVIEEEKNRLLYVALTRAEDRLLITGVKQKTKRKNDCWHAICEHSLTTMNAEAFDDPKLPGDAQVLRLIENTATRNQEQAAGKLGDQIQSKDELLAILLREPGAEPSPPSPLAPSRPEQEPSAKSPLSNQTRSTGIRRGILTHSLLEHLPRLKDSDWSTACDIFLAKPGHQLTDLEQLDIKEEVLAVLNNPDYRHLFSQSSQSEVPVVGLVGTNVISGRIDRLAVTDDEVLILDYKTNRPSPDHPSKVPAVYRRQLTSYRQLIGPLYPTKKIRTFLLWTDETRMMEITEPF